MRVVLASRDGPEGRYLAHRIAACAPLAGLVVESGRAARRRKLARLLRRRPWWQLPRTALDLGALAAYGRWQAARGARLAPPAYPQVAERCAVEDVNDPPCRAFLARLRPAVLVVYGTALLGASVIAAAGGTILNIHRGLVPAYRNVHCELWAYLAGDLGHIGVSILHLDESVDGGAIAAQRSLAPRADAGLGELLIANLELAGDLICEVLGRDPATLERRPQAGEIGFHPTPGAGELLAAWRRSQRR